MEGKCPSHNCNPQFLKNSRHSFSKLAVLISFSFRKVWLASGGVHKSRTRWRWKHGEMGCASQRKWWSDSLRNTSEDTQTPITSFSNSSTKNSRLVATHSPLKCHEETISLSCFANEADLLETQPHQNSSLCSRKESETFLSSEAIF